MTSPAAERTWTDHKAVTGGLAGRTLAFCNLFRRLMQKAKDPGFDKSGWDELAAMVDTEKFRLVSTDMAAMPWEHYLNLVAMWAATSDLRTEFHRISEAGNVVYLELTEYHHPRGGAEIVMNSCSVYRFDEAGKLVRLSVYMQNE